MRKEEHKLIIPPNVDLLFEDDCKGCDMAEPVVLKSGSRYRIQCGIVEICKRAKAQAASKRTKEFPYV